MKREFIITIILFQCFVSQSSAAESVSGVVDHGRFASLLGSHLRNGRVDYAGFKAEETKLDAYLDELSRIDPDQLDRNEQFAFYINLYNAWTIKLILTRYPDVSSIKDLGSLFQSPWQKKVVRLQKQRVTLDYLEHDILRPRFNDPRVHFAVNCASKSCPPLLSEPYTGSDLELQLHRVTQAFINDPHSNFIKSNTLYVSRIFKWFRDDFNNDIIAFFYLYATGELKHQLQNSKTQSIVKFLDYDWSLNDIHNADER